MSDKSVALQEFMAHAVTVQSFERVAQQAPGWDGLDVVQRQAVNVALDAIARVLHGDAQNPGVWACGGAALSLAGEFVTFTPVGVEPQPDADGWIEWSGGAPPVAEETQVHLRFRNGHTITKMKLAGGWDWTHAGDGGDIVAYRVVKTDTDDPQPDAEGWIEWYGGDQPVPDGTSLEARRRDGKVLGWLPEMITWSHDDKDVAADKQIVAYRVIK